MPKRVGLTLDQPVQQRLEELRIKHDIGPSLVIEALLMHSTPKERDDIIGRLVAARAAEKEHAKALRKKVMALDPEHLERLVKQVEARTVK